MNHKQLYIWYQENKRDLPWRQTTEPYKVWLSEIILQQTRVAQGLPYYQNFIEKYPSVKHLAMASEQEVLKLWQGLGYYSRARNLYFAANQVVAEYQGVFPNNFNDLLQLKGVGEYTAAAIASFCYSEAVPVIDGNVYRVLSRLYGVETPINTNEGRKIIKQLAYESIDKKNPGLYNQAIMEFGALQCVPANPKCEICPLSEACVAYHTGKVAVLPVKNPKQKIKKRYFHYFLVQYQDKILIQKRQGKGIWQNLYELPLLETKTNKELQPVDFQLFYKEINIDTQSKPELLGQNIHKLTHQHLYIHFWKVHLNKEPDRCIPISDLEQYPMPIVIANFLENIKL